MMQNGALPPAIRPFLDVPTAIVSDAMDSLSRKQCFMDGAIRRLAGTRIAGLAATIMTAPTAERAQHVAGMEVLDTAPPGTILVAGMDGEQHAALWGAPEIAVARSRALGGFVCDGAVRSVSAAEGGGFGIFAMNVTPAGGYGRIKTMAGNAKITCGGVSVSPGDLILGDEDGVMVVPALRIDEVAGLLAAYMRRQQNLIEDGVKAMAVGPAMRRHWAV